MVNVNAIHLAQKVKTPDGVGTVVHLSMQWTLLYHEINTAKAVVVYDDAVKINQLHGRLYFSFTYHLKDLSPV